MALTYIPDTDLLLLRLIGLVGEESNIHTLALPLLGWSSNDAHHLTRNACWHILTLRLIRVVCVLVIREIAVSASSVAGLLPSEKAILPFRHINIGTRMADPQRLATVERWVVPKRAPTLKSWQIVWVFKLNLAKLLSSKLTWIHSPQCRRKTYFHAEILVDGGRFHHSECHLDRT